MVDAWEGEGGALSEAEQRQIARLTRAMNDLNVRATNAEEYADNLAVQLRDARAAAEQLCEEWFAAKDRLDRYKRMVGA